MRGIMGIEDRNRQVVAIDDLDRTDHERVFGGKEFMTALVSRRNLIENAMVDETAQDLPQSGDRGQRLCPVSSRVDDLQAGVSGPSIKVVSGRASLHGRRKEPFAFPS